MRDKINQRDQNREHEEFNIFRSKSYVYKQNQNFTIDDILLIQILDLSDLSKLQKRSRALKKMTTDSQRLQKSSLKALKNFGKIFQAPFL